MCVVISISVIGVFHLSLWLTCFVVVLSRLEPKLILPRKNINLLLRKMLFLFFCLSLTFFSKKYCIIILIYVYFWWTIESLPCLFPRCLGPGGEQHPRPQTKPKNNHKITFFMFFIFLLLWGQSTMRLVKENDKCSTWHQWLLSGLLLVSSGHVIQILSCHWSKVA